MSLRDGLRPPLTATPQPRVKTLGIGSDRAEPGGIGVLTPSDRLEGKLTMSITTTVRYDYHCTGCAQACIGLLATAADRENALIVHAATGCTGHVGVWTTTRLRY